jgi:hypothetical protein
VLGCYYFMTLAVPSMRGSGVPARQRYCWSGAGNAHVRRVECPNQIDRRETSLIPRDDLSRLLMSCSSAGKNVKRAEPTIR